MDLRDGLVPAIGNTPLLPAAHCSERTGCEIHGKAEFLNPGGGSVKDRAALAIVLDAERRGLLRPVVDGNAGKTHRPGGGGERGEASGRVPFPAAGAARSSRRNVRYPT
jgi:hypothetical protein